MNFSSNNGEPEFCDLLLSQMQQHTILLKHDAINQYNEQINQKVRVVIVYTKRKGFGAGDVCRQMNDRKSEKRQVIDWIRVEVCVCVGGRHIVNTHTLRPN